MINIFFFRSVDQQVSWVNFGFLNDIILPFPCEQILYFDILTIRKFRESVYQRIVYLLVRDLDLQSNLRYSFWICLDYA